MSTIEYQELIEELKAFLEDIHNDPPGTWGFIVCLPSSNKAFFNLY